jgi:Tfp pilus assembly protein PilX
MKNQYIQKQQGMATLIVSIIVLIITTLMVLMATKVGIFDFRMAGNEARYKEAFATAEAGLDFAVQKFNSEFNYNDVTGFNAWKAGLDIILNNVPPVYIGSGTGLSGIAAGSSTPSFGVQICRVNTATGSCDFGSGVSINTVFRFTSTGLSADGSGTATVQREITMKQILGGSSPEVSILMSGGVGTGGNFNIVANPNGGGNGIPVSIWTNGNVDMSGSSSTCQSAGFTGNNAQCNSELISDGDGTNLSSYNPIFPDVLPNDPHFPSDIFRYIFGVARNDWETIYSMANSKHQVAANCGGLDTHSGEKFRLWWITGDCNMASNQIIGSQNDPVILVIDDHQLNMGGGGALIHGIPFLFDNPSNVATPSGDFQGSTAIYGALVSDVGGGAMNGSYSVVYDPKLLSNLTSPNESNNYAIGYIPGSWRDF